MSVVQTPLYGTAYTWEGYDMSLWTSVRDSSNQLVGTLGIAIALYS